MNKLIAEKNGFPKPIGMLAIMAVIMISSFVNLFFTGEAPSAPFHKSQQVIEAYDNLSARV